MNDVRLPGASYSVYGVDVAEYAEDLGCVVAGHGRRSYAAINAVIRVHSGWGSDHKNKVRALWVVLSDTCGCTAAQHELHTDCGFYGLPLCRDDYTTWIPEFSSVDTPGWVPVLEVCWYP